MAILQRAKSSIKGLVTDLDTLGQDISTESQTRAQQIGTLSELTTADKGSVVLAVNEVKGVADTAKTAADAAQSASEAALLKTANLSDLGDVGAARTNLEVMSSTEVEAAIEAAKLALGTNYTVDTIAERDALTGLDTLDRVFVKDDGDGKWANYQVGAVDEEGVVTEWIKIADQDALENTISAPAIKAALLSNPDTNVLTDAQLAKLEGIDTGSFLEVNQLVQLVGAGSEEELPSTAAVVAYVAEELSTAGAVPAFETLVVAGSNITLTNAPKGGIAGILNFTTVRYINGDGVAFDAPVVATGEANVFSISTDTADQWDGFSVQVQYLYVPA